MDRCVPIDRQTSIIPTANQRDDQAVLHHEVGITRSQKITGCQARPFQGGLSSPIGLRIGLRVWVS